MKNKFIYIAMIFSIITTSCDSWLQIEEENVLLEEDALIDAQDYEELLNSAYDVLRGSGGNFLGGRTQIFSDLLAHEIDGTGLTGDYEEIYRRSTGFFNGSVAGYYQEPYITIFRANVLLEEIEGVNGIDQNTVDRIKGEAYFLRAISHFDVLTLFAQPAGFTANNDHPGIVLRANPTQEIGLRSTYQESADLIKADLRRAESLLANGNDRGFGFADEYAAAAYLGRFYFYNNQYDSAYFYANKVIETGNFPLDQNLLNRFSQGESTEGVFVMPSLSNTDHRGAGFTGNYRSDVNEPGLKINPEIYNLVEQNADDQRIAWFTVGNEGETDEEIYINKYNGLDYFDVPLIHTTELKLIRAEAAAILNQNLDVAVADINDIRERAYSSSDYNLSIASTSEDIIDAARYERRIELVTEGNYLHDIKRIGILDDDANARLDGAIWSCSGLLLEFPSLESVEGFEDNNPSGC